MKPVILLTPHHVESLKPRAKEYALDDPQCPGLRLRILPGGTKSWVIVKRIDGKPKRITLGRWPDLTPDAARSAFYAREAALAPRAPVRETPVRTMDFATLAAHFMAHRATHFKPSSVGPFRTYLRAQLLPAFGNTSVGDLKPADIAKWFHSYSKNRPGGANQALGHFTTIINWGKAEGHLPYDLANPAAPLRKNRATARGRMLNFDQIRKLAHVLDHASERQWLAVTAPLLPQLLCFDLGNKFGVIDVVIKEFVPDFRGVPATQSAMRWLQLKSQDRAHGE